MEKNPIPFDVKYRPQIEVGQYIVVTSRGEQKKANKKIVII